jgi:hypothetical protein
MVRLLVMRYQCVLVMRYQFRFCTVPYQRNDSVSPDTEGVVVGSNYTSAWEIESLWANGNARDNTTARTALDRYLAGISGSDVPALWETIEKDVIRRTLAAAAPFVKSAAAPYWAHDIRLFELVSRDAYTNNLLTCTTNSTLLVVIMPITLLEFKSKNGCTNKHRYFLSALISAPFRILGTCCTRCVRKSHVPQVKKLVALGVPTHQQPCVPHTIMTQLIKHGPSTQQLCFFGQS